MPLSRGRSERGPQVRFIVGYAADDQGHEALELGAWLAAQYDAELTVAYVVPDDFPVPTLVDLRESLPAEVRSRVEGWLTRAEAWLADHAGVRADTRIVPAASPARGLIGLAHQLDARLIVLGSSRKGSGRHFGIGTVSGQLLHESPVPLALSPAGYEIATDTPRGQVWCGYIGTDESKEALAVAARVAARMEVPLRLVNFEVDRAPARGASADVELIVTEGPDAPADTDAELTRLSGEGIDVSAVTARGRNVDEAFTVLERSDDAADVLIIGSHRAGPLSRVFLGAMASRILRSSPWPVVAIPRGAAGLLDELAESDVDEADEVDAGSPEEHDETDEVAER